MNDKLFSYIYELKQLSYGFSKRKWNKGYSFLGAQATRAPLHLWFFGGRIRGRSHQLFEHLLLAALSWRDSFGIFYNISLIFLNHLVSFGIIWNHLKSFEIFWNLLESFGIFGIFWNFLNLLEFFLESLDSLVGLGLRSSSKLLSSSWSILGTLGLESI